MSEAEAQFQPSWSLAVKPDPQGKLFMSLVMDLGWGQFEGFLCRADNFQKVAKVLHDEIMRAGQDMARAELGLVVAKAGDIDVYGKNGHPVLPVQQEGR